MNSVPPRRPPAPPLPPRRRAPIPPPLPKDYEVREVFRCEKTATPSEISGLDSGISESSSVCSLPLVTNSSPENVNNNFSKLSLESEIYDSSVLSLPADSLFSRSVSLTENNLRRPPLPPVRKDSIKSARRISKTIKLKSSFEDKFSKRFHSSDQFPPVLPLSTEKKTYPTKELFTSSSYSPQDTEEDDNEEEEAIPAECLKKKPKKPQRMSLDPGTLFSKMMFGTPKSKPNKIDKKTANSSRGGDQSKSVLKENFNLAESTQCKKPPIARKPVLDRARSSQVLSPRPDPARPVSRSLSMSPAVPRPRLSVRRGGVEEEDRERRERRTEMVSRRAPPPPQRR